MMSLTFGLFTQVSGSGPLGPLVYFQEAYAKLFANCYNKQGIQSNLPSYTPINKGTICAKVYPEIIVD